MYSIFRISSIQEVTLSFAFDIRPYKLQINPVQGTFGGCEQHRIRMPPYPCNVTSVVKDRSQYKNRLSRFRYSHYQDETAVWPSYILMRTPTLVGRNINIETTLFSRTVLINDQHCRHSKLGPWIYDCSSEELSLYNTWRLKSRSAHPRWDLLWQHSNLSWLDCIVRSGHLVHSAHTSGNNYGRFNFIRCCTCSMSVLPCRCWIRYVILGAITTIVLAPYL